MISETNNIFALPCQICNKNDWDIIYNGSIRDGKYGNTIENSLIGRCNSCKVDRLDEAKCMPDVDYKSEFYRNHLGQTSDIADYQNSHDELQKDFLSSVLSSEIRNKIVCDIGCAGGSLLDYISGIANKVVAIEPAVYFHQYLKSKQYDVFSSVNDAVTKYSNKLDVIFLIQVIEHASDPVSFLKEIKPLLKKDGKFIISTPNRNDVLMKVYPEKFNSFFYRRAHRWYFDEVSLRICLEKAGFNKFEIKFSHRQTFSNALNWLKTGIPKGNEPIGVVTKNMELMWKSELERTGVSDTLIVEVIN